MAAQLSFFFLSYTKLLLSCSLDQTAKQTVPYSRSAWVFIGWQNPPPKESLVGGGVEEGRGTKTIENTFAWKGKCAPRTQACHVVDGNTSSGSLAIPGLCVPLGHNNRGGFQNKTIEMEMFMLVCEIPRVIHTRCWWRVKMPPPSFPERYTRSMWSFLCALWEQPVDMVYGIWYMAWKWSAY